MAQFILESGYGKSELAQGANNCFGMKKSLSGNTWGGSTWDGSSVYTKKTQEQKADGSYVTVTADFRRYGCVEDSIADHSAYLLGAKNGSKLRYEGLKGCTDYKKAAQIIKDGGYATSLTYVEKICSIIEKWKLTQYDVAGEASDVVKYYRVRKNCDDAASQLGAYTVLANAKAMADKHTGYEVYDWNGKQVYPEVAEGATDGMTNADCPFTVKVSIPDLNIRKGAGTNTAKTGAYTGVGVRVLMFAGFLLFDSFDICCRRYMLYVYREMRQIKQFILRWVKRSHYGSHYVGQMKNLLLVDPVKMVSMTILRNVNLKKYLGAT